MGHRSHHTGHVHRLAGVALLLLLPASANAQQGLMEVLGVFDQAFTALVPIAFSIAVLAFFWGMALIILNSGNEQQRQQGKKVILWGIIALFVIVSIWGIVQFITVITGTGQTGDCPPPQIGQNAVTACDPNY